MSSTGTAGTPSMWMTEFYYLDGQVTFTNREGSIDYNITVTPVTWQDVYDDVKNTHAWSGGRNARAALSLDPYVGPSARPASPVKLSATAQSESTVKFNWADCSDNERGFLVEYSHAGDFGDEPARTLHYDAGKLYTTGGATAAGTTSLRMAKLKPSTHYFARAKAHNELGDSEYSNVVEFTTPAAVALAAPWKSVDVGTAGVSGTASQADSASSRSGVRMAAYRAIPTPRTPSRSSIRR